MSLDPSGARANARKAKPDHPGYDENRQRIVEGAIALMAERGVNRLRFDDLAQRVGLNRTTIYRYFDSKRDLIAGCMLSLMIEITDGIIADTSGQATTTPEAFADNLFCIIRALRSDPRYGVIMDAQNVEQFAELSVAHMSDITERMLSKYLVESDVGRLLRDGLELEDVVPWLFHQIITYGFLGIPGEDESAQRGYLDRMVVPVLFGPREGVD